MGTCGGQQLGRRSAARLCLLYYWVPWGTCMKSRARSWPFERLATSMGLLHYIHADCYSFSYCLNLWLCFPKTSLTHSLVDLPRWRLATADDHSDIFLLHCARSCDISFSWMYLQPVHSSMPCIHCLLGLPWCRSPSMIPSRTVSANFPALPRIIWPKYCSFSFATLPINSLSRPNSVNIESFVRCSCH